MATTETIKNHASRLSALLGLQRSTVGVLTMVVLVGMGERMAERFLPIYMLALGGGVLAIGLLQAMDNFLSALYSFPGGYLSDRIGTKRSLLIFNLVAMAGFALVIVIPTWQAVLAGAVLFISWTAISLPATMSLMYKVLPTNKRGSGDTLTHLGLFFTKAAFVTFGGAYAVLSYITDVAVSSGWLSTGQMLIGLGLAESTPGPLIMVTQYAGFLAAWNLPGGLDPLTAGIIGALLTTYVTFLPCFFFIFAGAPFIEAMAGNQRLQAALNGVTAAMVGVVLNLAVWFGHKVLLPNGGIDLFAIVSAVASLVLLQKFHFPIHYLVPIGAVAGVIWKIVI